jgi:leucyl aminopeptidase
MNTRKNLSIEIATKAPAPQAGEGLALCVFADEPRVSHLPADVSGIVGELLRDGEFKGEAETSLLLHAADINGGERRLLLVGLGAHDGLTARTLNHAAGMSVRQAREAGLKRLHFILPASVDAAATTRAVVEGALLGLYENDFYQAREDDKARLESLTLVVVEANERISAEVERASVISEAINWARELVDMPGANLPPREFARRAAEMAAEFGLSVESLSADEIRERGMGALWGVGQGSNEPPALIVVRYEPEDASDRAELYAFVGKGITFDTGGISLKHGLDMWEMKSDMAGGAAVLGALRAIAQLKPRRRIIGLVPAAENMPSGSAIKPGDIVKTLAGHTIEVVDTDAEGRLVLVDGLAYAKQLGATRIVDLATLTGSIIVALGDHRTGLFSNDDAWANRVLAASERAGEPTWRMPVSDDYKKRIESPIADFKNYGGRPDATAAALLLSKFAAGTPWVHLDIAGTAWYDGAQPHAPAGASGTAIRTLIELACEEPQAS